MRAVNKWRNSWYEYLVRKYQEEAEREKEGGS